MGLSPLARRRQRLSLAIQPTEMLAGVDVFAVEDNAAQVCWSALPEGSVLTAGDARVEVEEGGRPGAAELEGLPADTVLDVVLRSPERPARAAAWFKTLPPPPGALLSRFATVSDLHMGERRFGLLRTLRHPGQLDHPLLCARAALREAVAWGAEAVAVKGDLTYLGTPSQWEDMGRLLGALPVPVMAVLGNHDTVKKSVDGRAALARHGIEAPTDPFSRDLSGIRLVMGHTALPGRSKGGLGPEQRRRIADLLSSSPGPAFLGMHHYLQRFRYPTVYPPGIPGPEARALLDAVASANPATFVSCGHSHRNRRHRHGPLVITEVGATMHYPGTWAGYAVYEGGIRQVVRRVAEPEALAWTERSRRALLGWWGVWAQGRRRDRCFTHPWPDR